jgi:carbamoyl-phosphate synthase large subunit
MINKRNLLLLSAGRRVELLCSFRAELKNRGLKSHILATDLKPEMSAACQYADRSFKMPRVTDEGYMAELLALCEQQDVGVVIPTIDTELLGLAQARPQFEERGIKLVVSDESLVYMCRDKRLTLKLFESLNIGNPELLDRTKLNYPCFVKPYDGSRSIGAMKISQASDLTNHMLLDQKLMFMEYINETYDEYTVDAYFDRFGYLKCLVPRHRLEIRDGEISKGVTRKSHVYEYLKNKLAMLKGARGCLTMQLFAHPSGIRYAALEINPRFGGGFPLSFAAGANYPGWIIDEYLLNKEIQFFENWEHNLLMLRYDSQVLVHNAG